MAKTIDERVVSMKFDNQNFERNVAESMSTLDKLKEKLSFKGASKGVDELNNAMGKFDFNPMANAVDYVGKKFSALEEIAKGALRKIGNDITGWVEGTVKSMSGLENMAAGFSKYSQKTTAVTTLVAQGFDLDTVNEQMEKLNWFTDETSYNFVSMVNEIGKFTASGQGLEESVRAMMGIANWAALSGQNATKASQAMYQLSQAMSKGALRYDDWKSIQNASMDTKEFREMAVNTAIALGSMKKVGEDAYRAVYETDSGVAELSEDVYTLNELFSSDGLTKLKWLDTDVMMSAFDQYGKATKSLKALVDEGWQDVDTASSAMDELEKKAKVIAQQMLESGEAVDEDDALNKALLRTSLDAVRGLESVKEEVRAYAEETGKDISTTEGFNAALIDLGYGIDAFSLKALKAAQQARTWEDVIDSVKDAVSTGWMNTFEKVIGNQEEAVTLMTRLANDFWDIFAGGAENRNSVFDVWRNWMEPQMRNIKGVPESVRKILVENGTFTDAINGRDLLFSTEEGNLGAIISLLQTIKDLIRIVSDAWNEAMYGTTDADEIAQQKADTLMSITKAIKSFADAVAINDEKADKLRRTFRGLFAIIDIIKTIIGSAFKAVWNTFSNLFGGTSIKVEDLTSNLGDGLVAFSEWIKESDIFGKIFEGIGTGISNAIKWIKSFIDYIASIPFVADAIKSIQLWFMKSVDYAREFFERLGNGEKASDILGDMIDRLSKVSDVVKGIVDFFGGVKDFFTNAFNGDSLKTFDIGKIFSGIGDAFKNAQNGVGDFWSNLQPVFDEIGLYIDGFAKAVQQTLGGLTFEKISKLIGAAALFAFIFRLINAVNVVTNAFKSFGEIGESVSKSLTRISTSFSKAITNLSKAIAKNINARSFKIIAEGILMIVGAISILYFMAMNNSNALTQATIVLGSLIVVMGGLVVVLGKVKSVYRASFVIGAIALSLMALTLAINMLTKIKFSDALSASGIIGVIGAIISILSLLSVFIAGKMTGLTRAGLAKKLQQIALMILSMSTSILLLAYGVKMLSEIDADSLKNAVGAISILSLIIAGLSIVSALITNKDKDIKGIGAMMLGISVSLIIIAGAIKVFSLLSEETFESGFRRIALVEGLIILLIAVSSLAGEHGSKAGSMILKISIAFAALVGVIALIKLLEPGDILKGLAVILAFELLVGALIVVSRLSGQYANKAGTLILMVAGAMAILTGVIWALSFLSASDLAKAGLVVSGIMAMFALLIFATKYISDNVKDFKGTLVVMTITIGVLAAAVAALALVGQTGDILKAAAAMSMVLGMFALVIAMTKFAQKAMGTLIILTVAVAAIGVVLYLLAKSGADSDAAIKNASAISILLLAISGAMVVISKLTRLSSGLIAGIVAFYALTGVIAILSAIMQDMSKNDISNPKYLEAAAGLSLLLAAFTGVFAVFAALGTIAEAGLIGMLAGIVAFYALTGVTAILSAILQDMSKNDITNSRYIEAASALSMLLLAFAGVFAVTAALGVVAEAGLVGILASIVAFYALTGVTAILSAILQDMAKVSYADYISEASALASLLMAFSQAFLIMGVAGTLAIPALIGMAVLAIAIEGIFAFANRINDFMSLLPIVQKFVDEGLPVLNDLSFGIGQVFGNFVAGIVNAVATGIFDIFPILGTKLSEFATNSEGFITTMSNLDDNLGPKVQSFANAILTLTAASLLDSLTSFFNFFSGSSGGLETFAGGLKAIGQGIADFSTTVNGNIYEEDIDLAVQGLQKLVDLNSTVDFIKTIEGVGSLVAFALNMDTIGKGIADFSTAVNGKMYPVPMSQAVAQLSSLVKLGEDINFIGLLGGTLSLNYFSSNLKSIGEGIGEFSAAVNGKGSAMYTTVAVDALGRLVKIGENMGFLEAISSASGLNTFAGNLENVADGIVKFSKKVDGQMAKDDIDTSVSVMERLSSLNLGFGFIDTISKLTGLDLFASNLPFIGDGIAKYCAKIKGQVSKADSNVAFGIINDLAALGNEVTGHGFGFITAIMNLGTIDAFAVSLPVIGTAISKFVGEIGGNLGVGIVKDSVNNALGVLKDLSTIQNGTTVWQFIDNVAGITEMTLFAQNLPLMAEGIGGFAARLKSLGYGTTADGQSAKDAILALADMNTLIEQLADNSKIEQYCLTLGSYTDSVGYLGDAIQKLIADSEKYDLEKLKNITSSLDEINNLAEKSKLINQQKAFSIPTTVDYSNVTQYMPDSSAVDISGYENMIKQATQNIDLSGAGIEGYSTYYQGFMGEDGSKITGMVDEMQKIMTGENGLGGIDLSTVGADLFSGFDTSFMGEDGSKITGMVDKFKGLLTGETGLGGLDLSGVGGDLVNQITGVFSGDAASSEITTAVKSFGTKFDTAVTEDIETYKTAGRNAVDGFVEGLKQKSWQVNQIGKDMADKLLTGIETGLDSHSPSRETYQRGIYAGQGFINALTDYVTRSFDAGENVAQSATDGMREAIEQSAYAFDASMEIQPTITPVVDLSNVQQSASAIDDIFSTDTSVGLVGNVARTMDENQQNIQNEISLDDTNIVNELRDLRTDMAIMAESFNNLQVRLDTNALVGELVRPMDTALGTRVNRKSRG